MKPTKRAFLVHGWDGRPDNHWFPWLTHQLVDRGFTVFAPEMPNAAHPELLEWLAQLSRVVGTPDERTYFVGHSLGCITIVRYLSQLHENVMTGGCVFVAGFSRDLHIPDIAEFLSAPVDFAAARSHMKAAVSVYSDDDEYVPVAEAKDFSGKLGAREVLEKGKGHFSEELQPPELPIVLSALLSLS